MVREWVEGEKYVVRGGEDGVHPVRKEKRVKRLLQTAGRVSPIQIAYWEVF